MTDEPSEEIGLRARGYWERGSDGETVCEPGWSVLPEFQGRGIATRATRLVVEEARRTGRRRSIHAYPSVDNPASNAICRKAGFTLLGSLDFEYPKGHPMRCNDWVFTSTSYPRPVLDGP